MIFFLFIQQELGLVTLTDVQMFKLSWQIIRSNFPDYDPIGYIYWLFLQVNIKCEIFYISIPFHNCLSTL
jgi:hypothetical protein